MLCALCRVPPPYVPWQVWVCLDEPTLPQVCLGDPGTPLLPPGGATPPPWSGQGRLPLACYGYNEATELFVYWGPNARLRLV